MLFSDLHHIVFDRCMLTRNGWVCDIDIFPHMEKFADSNVIPDRDSDYDDKRSLFGDSKKVTINQKRTSDKKSDSSSSRNDEERGKV